MTNYLLTNEKNEIHVLIDMLQNFLMEIGKRKKKTAKLFYRSSSINPMLRKFALRQ